MNTTHAPAEQVKRDGRLSVALNTMICRCEVDQSEPLTNYSRVMQAAALPQ